MIIECIYFYLGFIYLFLFYFFVKIIFLKDEEMGQFTLQSGDAFPH